MFYEGKSEADNGRTGTLGEKRSTLGPWPGKPTTALPKSVRNCFAKWQSSLFFRRWKLRLAWLCPHAETQTGWGVRPPDFDTRYRTVARYTVLCAGARTMGDKKLAFLAAGHGSASFRGRFLALYRYERRLTSKSVKNLPGIL